MFNLIYLTVYNYYFNQYYKGEKQPKSINFAASITDLVFSVAIVFLLTYVYKAILNRDMRRDYGVWLEIVLGIIIYFFLNYNFQVRQNLNFLYEEFKILPNIKRNHWKIYSASFFLLCFLSGFLPSIVRALLIR